MQKDADLRSARAFAEWFDTPCSPGGGGIASRIPPGRAGESAASLLKTLFFVVFIDMRVQKHVRIVFS